MERTKEEIAEIVFKALGGIRDDEFESETLYVIDHPDTDRPPCLTLTFSESGMTSFIYSWPYPNVLGLIIEKAKEMGWRYCHVPCAKSTDISFIKSAKKRRVNYIEKETETQKASDNPMYAVCKAFIEVLEKEGKL